MEDLKLIFRAFKYRNYRLFFTGQGISLIGTWMQRIAMSWLVFRLTNSSFLLGLVGFTSQIPTFILCPFAGVIADRVDRLRIMIVTQILSMIQAGILAFLVISNRISVWHVVILSVILGMVTAFDIPSRQSFIIKMVDKREDLGNAIAMNSFMFNSARLIGPSLAGIIISAFGDGICFLLNAISYIAIISALFAMKVKPDERAKSNNRILEDLKIGSAYTFGIPPIRNVLLLLGLVQFVGMPYTVLMPLFAKNILGGDANTLGFLMAGVGCGALFGAIFLASRKNAQGLDRIIPMASTIFGIGLIFFSLSRVFATSLLLISLCGFGMMVQMASCNTVLQTIIDDDKRGRVMSFYTMAFMGPAPFGSLLGGWAASHIGAPNTLIIGGIISILGAVIFATKSPSLRRMLELNTEF
ncbi:TPA: MFS transporter [Candidatus Poribacteria bacterium]|nr:MFS transporter [Candidatus Poribacteria bacterium]